MPQNPPNKPLAFCANLRIQFTQSPRLCNAGARLSGLEPCKPLSEKAPCFQYYGDDAKPQRVGLDGWEARGYFYATRVVFATPHCSSLSLVAVSGSGVFPPFFQKEAH